MENLPLTKNQTAIFDLIEGTSDNIFVTGKPGVGKSVLINGLVTEGRKVYTLGAPTGLAALNIGGKTLHSLFGLPVSEGIITPDYNRFSSNENVIKHARYGIKHLIIDEISMVRADTFDFIDRFLRWAKDESRPFGGVQVVIVGDFYQLPPIVRSAEARQFTEHGYASPFVFSSKVFETFRTVALEEVLRQKGDKKFIAVLHNAREGTLQPKDMVAINGRVEAGVEEGDVRIRLVSKNDTAAAINAEYLNKLPGEAVEFSATQEGVWPLKDNFPAEPLLRLKVGAQVMVKLNKADRPPKSKGKFESTVVNGDLGLVEKINFGDDYSDDVDEEIDRTPYVSVRLRKDARLVKIYRQRWEYKKKEKVGTEWEEKVIAAYEQIPIAFAWAISMHKSQGQSFEAVHIDPSSCFAAGQLYVALSRARSLEGLTLESRVHPSSFKIDPVVKRFYGALKLERV